MSIQVSAISLYTATQWQGPGLTASLQFVSHAKHAFETAFPILSQEYSRGMEDNSNPCFA